MSKGKITIKDIARESGLSIASVSRALNGLDGISEEKREKILEIADRLSYSPGSLAGSLARRRSKILGIIVPDMMSPFYSGLVVAAADVAHRRGFQVISCNSFRETETERSYIKLLQENQVAGILIFPTGDQSRLAMEEYLPEIPIVSLNEVKGESSIPYVCADERLAGRMATDYLIRLGCKNLMFFGFKPERLAHRYRAESFMKCAKEKRVLARVFECDSDFRTSFERGYDHFRRFLMEGTALPDGIVAASHATAKGIIKAAKEQGLRVPEDFHIVGFDQIEELLPYVQLTTVAVPNESLAERAVNLLLELRTNPSSKKVSHRVKLEPRLWKGQT